MNFANRLKKLRENAGLLQKELADKLECSPKTISGYERGEREPNITILNKISSIFGVSVDYLLGQDNSIDTLEESYPEVLRMLRKSDAKMTEKQKKKLVKIIELMMSDES